MRRPSPRPLPRALAIVLAAAVLPLAAASPPGAAAAPPAGTTVTAPGLDAPVTVRRTTDGVAHLDASTRHDLWFAQGWVHGTDRLFQQDTLRRTASGTLAELLGPAALPSDVQLRTLGLRRAAERSWAAATPRLRAAVTAYTEGVNARIRAGGGLPPEYGALELTSVAPWTPVDTIVIGKLVAFQLSFDLDTEATTQLQAYVAAGAANGFDGRALYLTDLVAHAPFSSASTIPDATGTPPRDGPATAVLTGAGRARLAAAARLAGRYRAAAGEVPVLRQVLQRREHATGSNEWAVCRPAHDGRPADPRQRPAPRAGQPVDLLPGPPARAGPGRRRRGLRRRARLRPGRQPVDRLGLDHQPDGRDRHLPGGGPAGPGLAERARHRLHRTAGAGARGARGLPGQRGRRRAAGHDRRGAARQRHPAGDPDRAAAQQRPDRPARRRRRHRAVGAVRRLLPHPGAGRLPAVAGGPRPRRLPPRAGQLRRRLAELVLRRPRRAHRVLHQRRAAAARGPAGRPGRRPPAVPGPQRAGWQRVAAGVHPLPGAGAAVRDPAAGRDAAAGGPAGRLVRQRQQRPDRRHAGQRPARPAPAGRRHLLPQRRLRRAAGRPHHRGAARGAAPRRRRRRGHGAPPGGHGAAGRGVLHPADRRGAAAGGAVSRTSPSCGRWPATRRSSRRSCGSRCGTGRPPPGSPRATTRPMWTVGWPRRPGGSRPPASPPPSTPSGAAGSSRPLWTPPRPATGCRRWTGSGR